MKRILAFFATLFIATGAWAVTIYPGGSGGGVEIHTLATLPGCTTGNDGQIVSMTDGNDDSDCTVGGGTNLNACSCDGDGTTWVIVGDGTAAGGQAVTLDVGDDGGNDSVDLGEIADQNYAYGELLFAEDTADKLLIDWDFIGAFRLDGVNDCMVAPVDIGETAELLVCTEWNSNALTDGVVALQRNGTAGTVSVVDFRMIHAMFSGADDGVALSTFVTEADTIMADVHGDSKDLLRITMDQGAYDVDPDAPWDISVDNVYINWNGAKIIDNDAANASGSTTCTAGNGNDDVILNVTATAGMQNGGILIIDANGDATPAGPQFVMVEDIVDATTVRVSRPTSSCDDTEDIVIHNGGIIRITGGNFTNSGGLYVGTGDSGAMDGDGLPTNPGSRDHPVVAVACIGANCDFSGNDIDDFGVALYDVPFYCGVEDEGGSEGVGDSTTCEFPYRVAPREPAMAAAGNSAYLYAGGSALGICNRNSCFLGGDNIFGGGQSARCLSVDGSSNYNRFELAGGGCEDTEELIHLWRGSRSTVVVQPNHEQTSSAALGVPWIHIGERLQDDGTALGPPSNFQLLQTPSLLFTNGAEPDFITCDDDDCVITVEIGTLDQVQDLFDVQDQADTHISGYISDCTNCDTTTVGASVTDGLTMSGAFRGTLPANSVGEPEIGTNAIGADQLANTAIESGDIAAGDLPADGYAATYLQDDGDTLSGTTILTGVFTADGGGIIRVDVDTFANIPGTCTVGDLYVATDSDGGQASLHVCRATNIWKDVDDDGAGSGSAIIFDIGDDEGDDSIDLEEISTVGDTNSIFTLQGGEGIDEMSINLALNWPAADEAALLDADTDGTNPEIDASGATIEFDVAGAGAVDMSLSTSLLDVQNNSVQATGVSRTDGTDETMTVGSEAGFNVDFDTDDDSTDATTCMVFREGATSSTQASICEDGLMLAQGIQDTDTGSSVWSIGSDGAAIFDSVSVGDSATPGITFDDSDDTGDPDADIQVECDDVVGHDCDMTFRSDVGGSLTEFLKFDADTSPPSLEVGDTHTGDILIGSGNTTNVTVATDGTGTAEVVLPAGSIDGTEVLDATLDQADIDDTDTLAGNPAHGDSSVWFALTGFIFEGATSNTEEGLLIAADIDADRTWTLPNITGSLLTVEGANAGTNLSCSGTTCNVDDSFLANDGDIGTGVYDFGGATSFEVPNGATPSTTNSGEIGVDTNAWTRGALQIYDGTANTYAVAALASDTPEDGQVPKWQTGGTVLWEDDSGGAGSGAFSDSGDPIVQNDTDKDVHMGDGAGTLAGKVEIGGDAIQPVLILEGFSTQTDSIFIIQQDGDTEVFNVENSGLIFTATGIDAIGAVDMDYGSSNVTDHNFFTDNTGDGSDFEIPVGSIETEEILDDDITFEDISFAATLASNTFAADDLYFGSNGTSGCLLFEGDTGGGNANEGCLTTIDPTADRTWTLPDESGTVVLDTSETVHEVDGTGLSVNDNTLDVGGGTCITAAADSVGVTADCIGATQIDETDNLSWTGVHTFDAIADRAWSTISTDVTYGDADEGQATYGTLTIGQANDTISDTVLDDIAIFYNNAPTLAEDISFAFFGPSDLPRFVLSAEGADLATYNPRSMVIGPVATIANMDENIICSTNFSVIDCDAGTSGADLGVMDDVEVLGTVYIGEALDGVGAVDMDYGSADITDHTFTTADAGDGSDFEIPVGSIETEEILDGDIGMVDIDGTINFLTSGTIKGAVGVTVTTDGTETVTALGEMYIADHATGTLDTTYTLPTASAGLSGCFYDFGGDDGGIILTPAADDLFVLDGTTMTADELLHSPGVAGAGPDGDFICILAIDAVNWVTLGRSGTWVQETP